MCSQQNPRGLSMTQPASQQTISLLRRKMVLSVYGKSRASLYRDIKSGLFTRPVKIGANSVAWPENEIVAINKARIAGKTEQEIKALVADLEASRVAV